MRRKSVVGMLDSVRRAAKFHVLLVIKVLQNLRIVFGISSDFYDTGRRIIGPV